jgi:2-keto-4-pentenoate hydratase/2-oxohepta-3-ene-1,7-dioic acid hydratase in catechol pathway
LPVIHTEDTGGTAFDYRFRLDKNGETVQQGCSMNMIHNVDQLISYISHYFTLKTGDLLYTGTPAGVGPVAIGDHLEGWIGEQRVLDLNCR